MLRTNKIDIKRLERFKFNKLDGIKTKLKTNPELSVKLREDFFGTAKAQGVNLDTEALEEIRVEWRTQIQSDIKTKARASPFSDIKYNQL